MTAATYITVIRVAETIASIRDTLELRLHDFSGQEQSFGMA